MRVAIALVALLMIPAVAAEFGHEENGWPVGKNGFSHDPAVNFAPEVLAKIQADAWASLTPEQLAMLHDAPLGPLNQAGPATIYPYYPIAVAEMQRLAELHPEVVRLSSAGKSELGLDLWMMEIGDFSREAEADFLPFDEREVVWIDGGTHSNEYSGVYFVLAVAQYLIEGYGSDDFATWVVENRHTWIMPMVNPDGSHVMGRLNANLVNINRNYPVIWGGAGTDAGLNNPGPYAGSEIETQVNIEWYNKTNFDYMASIHCCGNLWLFPYGEDGYDPLDVDMMNRVCDVAFPPEIRTACGPIWSTIYPASGSSVDTAYEYTGAVSFGFEMSGRSNLAGPWGEPATFAEVFAQEAESWMGIKHAFENVHLYGAYPQVESVDFDGDLLVTIRNAGMGNLTGGQASIAFAGSQLTPTDLPWLEPNQSATIRVTLPDIDGEGSLQIDYVKRIMSGPTGRISIPLVAVTDLGAPSFEGDLLAVPLSKQVEPEASVEEAASLPALLVAIALLVVVARRR